MDRYDRQNRGHQLEDKQGRFMCQLLEALLQEEVNISQEKFARAQRVYVHIIIIRF